MSKASDAVLDLVTGSASEAQARTRREAEAPRDNLVATNGKLINPKTSEVTMEAPLDVTD
jgi:hypothetical protein